MSYYRVVTFRIILSGRVQGVGCRARVREMALKRGLRGTVRNLPSGEVEVMIQIGSDQCEQFCDDLRALPRPVQVQQVVVESINEGAEFDGRLSGVFEILRD